jgi:hypothetical protein
MKRPIRMEKLGAQLPLGTSPASVRQRVEALEKVLERAFVLPGTNRPIGVDAVLGVLPIAGDTISAVVGLYLVWEARNLGMSRFQLAKMFGRVGVDWLIGLVPVAGDVFDFVYRSNSRNVRAILRHLDRHHPETRILEEANTDRNQV